MYLEMQVVGEVTFSGPFWLKGVKRSNYKMTKYEVICNLAKSRK